MKFYYRAVVSALLLLASLAWCSTEATKHYGAEPSDGVEPKNADVVLQASKRESETFLAAEDNAFWTRFLEDGSFAPTPIDVPTEAPVFGPTEAPVVSSGPTEAPEGPTEAPVVDQTEAPAVSTPAPSATPSDSADLPTPTEAPVFGPTEAPAVSSGPTEAPIGPGDNIADIVAGDPNFSTLASLLQQADLISVLEGDGPFTVFAPTNAAFEALPPETLASLTDPANSEALTDVLLYHVVEGEVLSSDLQDGVMLTTVQGDDLVVTVSDQGLQVNGVNVVTGDIEATNGVIHVIDGVLL
jgi:uncharacterized surface protein with fasciclin (FAS1) repeats